MSIMSVIGILATGLLIFAARPLFKIFIQEEETVRQGIVYLGFWDFHSYLCIEATTAGAFNGLGRTIPPSFVGIFSMPQEFRCLLLSATRLGLNGIWWTISITSIFKGVVLCTWYLIMLKGPRKRKQC